MAAGDGIRAIDVFANADSPSNDIVLHLFRGTEQVASADTLRTPERIRYAPDGGVPAGDYYVQVCEFQDGAPPVDPRTYTGTVTLDNSPAPAPYLARWDLFPANPPLNTDAADPWGNPSTDTRQKWCWKASTTASDCDRVVGNLASRTPWDVDGKTGAQTNTTTGNNARTAESWRTVLSRGRTSSGRSARRATTRSRGRTRGSPATATVANRVRSARASTSRRRSRTCSRCTTACTTGRTCSGSPRTTGTRSRATSASRRPSARTTQSSAIPRPGRSRRRKDRDNANMTTLPDGSSSITNMYLWQPLAGAFYPPCVDGDYDAGVIGHEYTHMIENRTIGKGASRTGFHAGSMGEAVGDLFAIEMLNEYGFVPTSDENRWAEGAYATGNKLRGIRNYAGNFPYTGAFPTPSTYPQVDPLNFSDIGYDVTGPEVHADGEIWIAINFELRRALAAKYNAQYPESDQALQTRCADGAQPVAQCPGNRRWIQLLFDSFLLDPLGPSMIDARNNIIAADQMRFGGADLDAIWGAFARRGLGEFASSSNGSGRTAGVESDTNPLPDFRVPGGAANNATVTFAAVSRQAPESAVERAHLRRPLRGPRVAGRRHRPVDERPGGVEREQPRRHGVLRAGHVRVRGDRPRLRRGPLPADVPGRADPDADPAPGAQLGVQEHGLDRGGRRHAVTSPTSGSEVQSAAQVRNNLIDDTEATDWQAAATQSGASYEVDGRQVTVDLGGTSPVRINRVQVSALLGPVFDPTATPRPADVGQNRFTALRRFEIDTCNARVADCTQDDNYQRAYLSPADAFPADVPRPVAPTLLLRDFTFSPVQATHVRIVVRSSQCTGGPAYQGEQDNDPLNQTDCNAVPPAAPAVGSPAATRFVRIAELQAFSQNSTVTVG